jgi:hypothetical protein
MAENSWKQFFSENSYQTSYSMQKMLFGPMSGVQLFYDITQGAYYTRDPIWLPYGPP